MIAVYVKPETLTVEQYNKARKGLDASGANMVKSQRVVYEVVRCNEPRVNLFSDG